MRDGKELEWHPQGSGKPIDFGIGRKLISASSFDRRSNPMPDRSASRLWWTISLKADRCCRSAPPRSDWLSAIYRVDLGGGDGRRSLRPGRSVRLDVS